MFKLLQDYIQEHTVLEPEIDVEYPVRSGTQRIVYRHSEAEKLVLLETGESVWVEVTLHNREHFSTSAHTFRLDNGTDMSIRHLMTNADGFHELRFVFYKDKENFEPHERRDAINLEQASELLKSLFKLWPCCLRNAPQVVIRD